MMKRILIVIAIPIVGVLVPYIIGSLIFDEVTMMMGWPSLLKTEERMVWLIGCWVMWVVLAASLTIRLVYRFVKYGTL